MKSPSKLTADKALDRRTRYLTASIRRHIREVTRAVVADELTPVQGRRAVVRGVWS